VAESLYHFQKSNRNSHPRSIVQIQEILQVTAQKTACQISSYMFMLHSWGAVIIPHSQVMRFKSIRFYAFDPCLQEQATHRKSGQTTNTGLRSKSSSHTKGFTITMIRTPSSRLIQTCPSL
jgi:hypothetical protein